MIKKIVAAVSGLFAVLTVALLFYPPLTAWAQQEVMLVGQDSSGNSVKVRVASDGTLLTSSASSSSSSSVSASAHGACTHATQTIGTTATDIPATERVDRSFLTIELTQAGETLDCEFDGSDAVSGTGIVLEHRGIFTIELSGAVEASCLCSASSCVVRTMECP